MRPPPYSPPIYTAAERAAIRLADAAPDMLKALEGLELVAAYFDTASGMTLRELFPMRFEAADKAIAKAKGTA